MKEFLFVACLISSGLGFMFGAFDAGFDDKCAMDRIIAYFPPHWIACELFEKRWSK